MAPGAWRIDLLESGTFVRTEHVQDCPDIGPACAQTPAPSPYLHHGTLTISETDLSADYGLRAGLAATILLPVKTVRATIRYTTLDGAPYDPPDAGIHHRNETLFGSGDAVVGARLGRGVGPVAASALIAASLPLGVTHPNPFLAGIQGRAHEHIQFGTGIFEPVLGASASLLAGAGIRVAANGQATLATYRNRHGMRPSSRFSGALAAARSFGRETLSLDLAATHDSAESWTVYQDATEGNRGRTDVLLGARASRTIGGGVDAGVGVSVPIYVRTTGQQIHYPAIVSLRLSWATATAR